VRVVMSTYDSRGGVEPLLALGVQLQEAGAEAMLCAPPDCVDRAAEVGVPLVPVGPSVRELVHAPVPPTPADVPARAAALIATQFDELSEAARGCDVIVTSGLVPAMAGAMSVAEMLGVPGIPVAYCPIFLPSPHHRPPPLPGRPLPADEDDQQVLDALTVESYNVLFGAPLNQHRERAGLSRVADVRALTLGEQRWLAADPVLGPWRQPADLEVVQTGAWLLPDHRPLPSTLEAFLEAGDPPVFVGFGSMRAPVDFARVTIEAVRGHGRRVVLGHGWSDLAAVDDQPDCHVVGEVNQQALFSRVAAVVHHGGAGTTTVAARAGAPQVVVPQIGDQPYWAGRTAALEIGTAHDRPVPTVESLSGALEAVLTAEVRDRAAEVSTSIQSDGAARAANLLLAGAR
jgi:vancomycin aglycone glucosyltransferase